MSARRVTMRWRLAAHCVLRAADRLVRPRTGVILHSQPDLDDNLVALLRCVPIGLEHAVLVDDLAAARRRSAALGLGSVLPPGATVGARHLALPPGGRQRSPPTASSAPPPRPATPRGRALAR